MESASRRPTLGRRVGRGARGTVLAVAALLLGACASEREATAPIRVAYSTGSSVATLWITDQQGYFAAEGVRIEWLQQPRPSVALPQIAVGNYDVMVVAVTIPLFNLIARGEQVRIVADRGHHAPGRCAVAAFVLRADRDPDHLPARLKFSAGPGYLSEFLIDRVRRSLGVAAEAWEVVDVPEDAEVAALARGGVDLSSFGEPNLTRVVEEGVAKVWRSHADLYPGAQQYLLIFGPRLLGRDRELGVRFLAAYLRTEREMARGKSEENVARMAEALDIDLALARRICWLPVRDDLRVDEHSLNDFQRWAADKRLLDRPVPIEDYWDGSFAEQAVTRLARRNAALR